MSREDARVVSPNNFTQDTASGQDGLATGERSPAPRWLVLVGMGLLMLVAAFAAWLVSREPVDATERQSVPAPSSRTETALQALDARVGQLTGRLDTLAEEIAGWEAQWREQESVLAALEEKIATALDAGAAVTDQVREIDQAAEARFTRLEADVAKLGQAQRTRLGSLASELKEVRKQLASKHPVSETADHVPDAVPFRLVSVDRWGEAPSAVGEEQLGELSIRSTANEAKPTRTKADLPFVRWGESLGPARNARRRPSRNPGGGAVFSFGLQARCSSRRAQLFTCWPAS